MAIKLYNTLSRKKQTFKPLKKKQVGLYACGPTVYDYTHIGHLKKYIGDDILKRVLEYNSYKVNHVMNITDVGHLVSDADAGEDKMEKGARERGMTVWEVAKFYEDYFWQSIDAVNIKRPDIIPRATEHIKEQISLIKKLLRKGFAYQTKQAIYFDVSKFPNYTKLSGQKLEEKVVAAREEVEIDTQKRNPQDFSLWFFTIGRFANHTMRWPSPWGEGFPGWHIECSAMSMKYLDETIDIHTGGIDHIPVHHTNEIAQSEAATGKPFVKFWIHHEFLLVDGEKMSKSKKNFYTIDDIKQKGFNPLAFRYFVLNSHYRSKLNFTWQGLKAAQNALNNLYQAYQNIITENPKNPFSRSAETKLLKNYRRLFLSAVNDDLNTPQALAVIWDAIGDIELTNINKKSLLLDFDKILGLKLSEIKPIIIPRKVKKLSQQREKLRQQKKWQEADKIRKQIEELGYIIEDTKLGPQIKFKQ